MATGVYSVENLPFLVGFVSGNGWVMAFLPAAEMGFPFYTWRIDVAPGLGVLHGIRHFSELPLVRKGIDFNSFFHPTPDSILVS